eukprot:349912-Chlamydomonas_euryale.AAC.5
MRMQLGGCQARQCLGSYVMTAHACMQQAPVAVPHARASVVDDPRIGTRTGPGRQVRTCSL